VLLFYKSANLNYPPSFLWLFAISVDEEKQNWKLKAESNFTWYQLKAQDGKPDSLFNLGLCFYYGIGTEGNYKKAVELYSKAAKKGFAASQYNLGYFYEYGIQVPKDMNKALGLYSKSAEQGYASAQHFLGLCYSNGKVVPQDFKRAFEFFRKVAEQGLAKAQRLNLSHREVDNMQALVDVLKVDRIVNSLQLYSL
jgi:TPR repeat protein